MIVLGADPDLHRPATALYDAQSRRVLAVKCPAVSGLLKGRDAALAACTDAVYAAMGYNRQVNLVVVEGQEIVYTARSGANPRDIMLLATVAGAMLAHGSLIAPKVKFPPPQMWKKGVPKPIHQARILDRIGWANVKQTKTHTYPLSLPYKVEGAENLKSEDWKHVVDAIGLALWGASNER